MMWWCGGVVGDVMMECPLFVIFQANFVREMTFERALFIRMNAFKTPKKRGTTKCCRHRSGHANGHNR